MFIPISCKVGAKNTNDYIPYAEISKNYSLDDAKNDGLIVYENGNITSGQVVWDEFLEKIEQGNSAEVRLAFYYTLDGQNISPEHYEEIKNDYPLLFIQDLFFNGEIYTLHYIEDGNEFKFNYKYLKRFNETSPRETATYIESVRYVLVNDNNVTWEQIFFGMISSRIGDGIDHKTVYSKYINKD